MCAKCCPRSMAYIAPTSGRLIANALGSPRSSRFNPHARSVSLGNSVLVRQQYRQTYSSQDRLRCASQDDLLHAVAPDCSHDKQVGVLADGYRLQDIADWRSAACSGQMLRLHTAAQQKALNARQATWIDGLVVADRNDRHDVGARKDRHRIAQRPGGK